MTVKICPRCGFEGDLAHCPNDGDTLLSLEEVAARRPADPTQAPPPPPPRRHAPAGDEGLRDENFGKWAEPEVRKKAKDPMLGRVIAGRYEILSLLGQGGMGAVYKARQPSVQRMIALKILLKEFAENETVIKRFHQEALAASRLTHPNTISVYDFGQSDDGTLFMAMEYLRGESLAQALVRSGPMPPKRVIHIMRQVCKSLAEAHKAGIIHRDLKPDNIFLNEVEGERDFVKVLDFGVAKLKEYEGKEGTLTQAGMIFGTPKYMSPEQARSADLDSRSDVYALGVILYEMLMGKPPFLGDNPLSILIAHVNEHPRPFSHFNPDVPVPTPLEAVVFKALNKDRTLRQANVEQLLAELDACDELLAGASYDSVADRLPGLVPGPDGSPSLVGPAVVPAGTPGTAPAASVGARGGTLVIGEDGVARPREPENTGSLVTGQLDATRDLSPPPTKKGGVGLWLALAAVPLVAGGAWLALRSPVDPPPLPTPPSALASQPPSQSAPPSVGPPVTAPPSLAALSKDAGVGEPERPTPGEDLEARRKSCLISTTPAGASIFEATRLDAPVGVTKTALEVKVAAPTRYVIKLSGYRDREVTVDPREERCVYKEKLAPLASAIVRPPPTPGSDTIRVVGPAHPPATEAARPPATRPIDLQ